MVCKLYIKHGPTEKYMGQFKTREKAKENFEACRRQDLKSIIQPHGLIPWG